LIEARADCELVAVVAPALDENRTFAADHCARFYTDFSEALTSEKPDAAIISSPNSFHYEQALACVSRGIPALVEKPMTSKLDEAALLLEAVERSGVPLLVGHHRTYSPLSMRHFVF